MVRQKVKGTGHKQPADVSSEPNFYAMSAVGEESKVDASPGLHGAASLLQGIASGYRLPQAPFVRKEQEQGYVRSRKEYQV